MKTGRPRIVIDWDEFERMCEVQCTLQEIAHVFHVSEDTIERACKREHGKSFADLWAQKAAGGRKSLRRQQFHTAMGSDKGAVTMQIWLGKQWLGQTDKMETRELAWAKEVTENLEDPDKLRRAITTAEEAIQLLRRRLDERSKASAGGS